MLQSGQKKKKRRFINEHLVDTLDGTGVSDRQGVRIITAVVQALDFKLDELVISRSTLRRKRIENREKTAQTIKNTFKVNLKLLQIHIYYINLYSILS